MEGGWGSCTSSVLPTQWSAFTSVLIFFFCCCLFCASSIYGIICLYLSVVDETTGLFWQCVWIWGCADFYSPCASFPLYGSNPAAIFLVWPEEWNRTMLQLFGGCYAPSPSDLFHIEFSGELKRDLPCNTLSRCLWPLALVIPVQPLTAFSQGEVSNWE